MFNLETFVRGSYMYGGKYLTWESNELLFEYHLRHILSVGLGNIIDWYSAEPPKI